MVFKNIIFLKILKISFSYIPENNLGDCIYVNFKQISKSDN